MKPLLTTQDIAELLKVGHLHVRDVLVKRPDFPRPAINLSQKMRRWEESEIRRWIDANAKKNQR